MMVEAALRKTSKLLSLGEGAREEAKEKAVPATERKPPLPGDGWKTL